MNRKKNRLSSFPYLSLTHTHTPSLSLIFSSLLSYSYQSFSPSRSACSLHHLFSLVFFFANLFFPSLSLSPFVLFNDAIIVISVLYLRHIIKPPVPTHTYTPDHRLSILTSSPHYIIYMIFLPSLLSYLSLNIYIYIYIYIYLLT